jgi:ubiquinone/menaquinone biosynthesis C-methylase UbiE/uncharacterized protein YbaR (Trm112 family)
MTDLDPWFLDNLVCPCDKQRLSYEHAHLFCPAGHRYPVVQGIPVMVLDNAEQTHPYATESLAFALNPEQLSDQQNILAGVIDPFVQTEIGKTNGIMYQAVIGKLREYPIPQLRLPYGQGQLLLDIGCNWGRWCVAAGRSGYCPVGIDPSLEAVLAARRVAAQLGIHARFVVGDARYLPFRDGLFDVVFSYSVLQHFARENVVMTLKEVRRVLQHRGTSFIQMLNSLGLRSLYNQVKRGPRSPERFEVRYWHPAELLATFSNHIGSSQLQIDGFFSANAQLAEAHILPVHLRTVAYTSEFLRRFSGNSSLMTHFADSLYVLSTKQALEC